MSEKSLIFFMFVIFKRKECLIFKNSCAKISLKYIVEYCLYEIDRRENY